jgi:hypothetical protein
VDLYIPSTQVLEIGDNRLTVGCARDDCEERYNIRPTGLEEQE